MTDNPGNPSYRSGGRQTRIASSSASDPLAELARLIGRDDPFGEYGREQARHAEVAAPSWNAVPPPPSQPPREQPPAYAHEAEPDYHADAAYASHEQSFEHGLEDPNITAYETEQHDFYDDEPPRRRTGILVVGAVFALAVIGTAGAFGYRAVFGSPGTGAPPVIKPDPAPIKVQPPKQDTKLIQERAPAPASEKLAAAHEEPVNLKDKPAGVIVPGGNPTAGPLPPVQGNGIVGAEPKRVHTITIRPDMTNADPNGPPQPPAAAPAAPAAAAVPEPPSRPAPQQRVAAVPDNAPLSLNPNAAPAAPAPAAPNRTASIPSPRAPAAHNAAAGGFAVQLSARRSEAEAQAAFHSLQAKFPNQLNGHQPLIRRVELGDKGTYFRAMVGPFASQDEASKLCAALKAAGGSCFVQRI